MAGAFQASTNMAGSRHQGLDRMLLYRLDSQGPLLAVMIIHVDDF